MNNDLNKRFAKEKRKWGKQSLRTAVVMSTTRRMALEARQLEISQQLGRDISLSQVINDSVARDPEIHAIEEQLAQQASGKDHHEQKQPTNNQPGAKVL